MDTEIEQRTNEYHITDHIKLHFSICHVWSEEEDFVAQILLLNFSESEWTDEDVTVKLFTRCVSSSSFRHPYHLAPGFLIKIVI